MYRYIILVGLLSTFSNCVFSNNIIELDTIKIVSWNIQMTPKKLAPFSKVCRKKQKSRAPEIIQYLNATNFDVVVLQELFDKSITKKFQNDLKINFPYQLSPIKEGFNIKLSSGVMILSKYPLEMIDHITFNVSKKIDRVAKKGCSLVRINIGETQILVGGTHLDSHSKESRNKQYEILKNNIIKAYLNDTVPLFLVGDFNTAKSSGSYKVLDSLITLKNFKLNDNRPYTFDEFNTWNEKGYKAWIDFIFYQDSKKIEVLDQYILRPVMTYKKTNMDLSDHYQIVLKAVIH
tara:strand:+ start:39 stop:911 length:873 start_codon:yes stop_codon:yes gene_type:complete